MSFITMVVFMRGWKRIALMKLWLGKRSTKEFFLGAIVTLYLIFCDAILSYSAV